MLVVSRVPPLLCCTSIVSWADDAETWAAVAACSNDVEIRATVDFVVSADAWTGDAGIAAKVVAGVAEKLRGHRRNQLNERAKHEALALSVTDHFSQLYNRRGFARSSS